MNWNIRRRRLGGNATLHWEFLEERSTPAVITWDGGGGTLDWMTPANWVGDALPTAADDVVIGLPATDTVTLSGAAVSIQSLTCNSSLTVRASANLNLASASTIAGQFLLSSSVLDGTGDLTVAGAMTFTNPNQTQGGTIAGSGQVSANGGLTLSGSSWLYLTGKTLTFGVGCTFAARADLRMTGGATLNIPAGLTMTLTDIDSITRDSQGGSATLNNMGTFRCGLNSNSQSSLDVTFNSPGTIDVVAGFLSMRNTTFIGSASVATNAKLYLDGGNNINAGASFSGAGTVFANQNTNTFNAIPTLSGSIALKVQGGIAIFNIPAPPATPIPLTITGGTVTCNSDVTFASLVMSSGILNGPGTIDVNGPLILTGSSLSPEIDGAGIFNAHGPVSCSGSGFVVGGRTFNLIGGCTLTHGVFLIDRGGIVNISAGAFFDISLPGSQQPAIGKGSNGGTATVNVLGTLRKNVPTFTVSIGPGVTVNNYGSIEVPEGILEINNLSNYSANVLNEGYYVVTGRLSIIGSSILTNAANIVVYPAGTLAVTGSMATNAPAGTMNIKSGATYVTNVAFTNNGSILVDANGVFMTNAGNYTQAAGTTLVEGMVDPTTSFDLLGGILTGGGVIAGPLNAGGTGIIAPGTGTGILTVNGNVALSTGAILTMELNGTTAGSGYDRVKVVGSVNLSGVQLLVTRGYAPTVGDSFIIVDNNATDAVVGTFAGLPEGANFDIGGCTASISYHGGSSNNDIVLTIVSVDATAPKIVNVYFDSSTWSPAFRAAAGNGSYGYPAQSASQQLVALPWNAIDTIYVQFSKPVNIQPDDLAIRGLLVGVHPTGGFSYDASVVIAKWTITDVLDTDRYIVDLDGDSASAVVDFAGNRLAGDWTEGVSTFPTTGGAGIDFKYRFVIGVGDSDRNGLVRNADLNVVRANLFIDAGQAGYNIFADIDGNGQTRNADLNAVRSDLFNDPPTGPGPNRPIRDQARADLVRRSDIANLRSELRFRQPEKENARPASRSRPSIRPNVVDLDFLFADF